MRVIAGKAKGHKIVAPKTEATRPALDRVKESIFSILFNVKGDTVLDLFAGSGSIGIEALSRGARHCVFVEKAKLAVTSIHKNLHRCKMLEEGIVMAMPVDQALKKLDARKETFDLIFIDPPYERNLVNRTLKQLALTNLVHEKARMIVEHHPHEPIDVLQGFVLTDQRRYGQTLVSFLTKANAINE